MMIFVMAHERREAVEAYEDILTKDQKQMILEEDCDWKIKRYENHTEIEKVSKS